MSRSCTFDDFVEGACLDLLDTWAAATDATAEVNPYGVLVECFLFVAALVSNQWEIAIFACRFSTKCHNSEIFSIF